MTTTELENALIDLAKNNPVEDYYVGDVGASLREILREWMGKRYPARKIDPPQKKEKRPKDEVGGLLWDEAERIEEMIEGREARSVSWVKLLSQEKFPENLGKEISFLPYGPKRVS